MAVHTELEREEIETFVGSYGLDPPVSAAGVAEGSIHTTYRLRTAARTLYLRLTEGLDPDDVDFELALLDHLAGRGFPCPRLVHRPDGARRGELHGRPAVLFEEVPGTPRPPDRLRTSEAAAVGALLAGLHAAGEDFEATRENPYGPDVVARWLDALDAAGGLEPEIARARPRLRAAFEASRDFEADCGPGERGVIHADLFTDNVHWTDDAIAGVLDFEMACTASRVLDLAIVLWVWCWDDDARALDTARGRALLRSYSALRPLSASSVERLPAACAFSAVRYAVSRIRDFHLSELPAERLVRKDWQAFDRRLQWLERVGADGLVAAVGL